MEFALTEQQRDLVTAAREYSAERLAPHYRARDRAGELDRDTLAEMGKLGFLGVEFPERLGGLGQDCLTAGLVVEALCAEDMNIGYVTINASLVGQILREHGRPDVVEPWISRLLRGEILPSIALTEPGGGSDAASLSLRARRDGEDYVLTGEKTSITFATQAAFCVVFARTGTPESRARGVSAFLVPLDSPGLTRTAFDDLGGRSVGRGSLHFDGVRVPASHMLGDEGTGFSQVMAGFDYSRALLGILCLAVARVSLDETWGYSTRRESMGAPLWQHQGVSRSPRPRPSWPAPACCACRRCGSRTAACRTRRKRRCASGGGPSSPTTSSGAACSPTVTAPTRRPTSRSSSACATCWDCRSATAPRRS